MSEIEKMRPTLKVYRSLNERLVLCRECHRLVVDRLNFTDLDDALATDECTVCGADYDVYHAEHDT